MAQKKSYLELSENLNNFFAKTIELSGLYLSSRSGKRKFTKEFENLQVALEKRIRNSFVTEADLRKSVSNISEEDIELFSLELVAINSKLDRIINRVDPKYLPPVKNAPDKDTNEKHYKSGWKMISIALESIKELLPAIWGWPLSILKELVDFLKD